MHTLLRLDCSSNGEQTFSHTLGDAVEAWLVAASPSAAILRRNLADDPPPPVDRAFSAGLRTHQTAEATRGVAAFATSEALIQELETTDVLLLTTPMHNFTLPAVLKLWLDQVVRFGRTFESTPEGKIGLLADRPTFICITSGSLFSGDEARQPDFLTPYLKAILACIGLNDLTFFQAEAAGHDPEAVMATSLAEIQAHPRAIAFETT
jgi:FMN-dependent NADH-azoreductase